MITADTITDEQIRALRVELVDAESWPDVSVCTVALYRWMPPMERKWLMEPYHSIALATDRARTEARARCAEILNARTVTP